MKPAYRILAAAIVAALAGAPAAAAEQGAAPAVALGVGMENRPDGIRVARVFPGGTAAAIGVQEGDVILQVGGRAATGPEVVGQYVSGLAVGDPVSVQISRDGRTVELTGRALARPEGFQVGQPAPED